MNNRLFLEDKLEENSQKICDYFNNINILKKYIINFYLDNKDGIFIKFFVVPKYQLNEKYNMDTFAYSNVTYYIDGKGNYTSSGRGVKSLKSINRNGISNSKIKGIGSFLIHLHILLSKITNIKYFFLENFTNDPTRAAYGIYDLFNIRSGNNNYIESRYKKYIKQNGKIINKNQNKISNALYEYEGEMRLELKKINLEILFEKLHILDRKNWNNNDLNIENFKNTFEEKNNRNKKTKRKRNNNNNNLNIVTQTIKSYDGTEIKYRSSLQNEGIEVGSFEIEGPGFNTGKTMNMSISINNESNKYQGKGYSRKMIKTLCDKIKREYYPDIRNDQLLFINTNASQGFWDKVGMKKARYHRSAASRNVEGLGYEKEITFNELCKFGNHNKKRRTVKAKRR